MTLATRVIARLDVKPNLGVVKGVRMEGLKVVGDPCDLALQYVEQGADEILYVDITASLYGRPMSLDVVERMARDVYVPITVGGGVRTCDDIRAVLRVGADKVAINTGAVEDPTLIARAASRFGSQAIVASVDTRPTARGWESVTCGGREPTGRDAIQWCCDVVAAGAGELLVTSIDRDGTRRSYDTAFLRALGPVTVPLVISGGAATPSDCRSALAAGADAVAIGTALHAGEMTIGEIKEVLAQAGMEVRR